MKILKMRASFGKLKGELDLQDGMNLLTLPNEEGKSTWTAFIIAMFYGIDTKERSNQLNNGLPAKEKYRPWNGGPMEGSIDLEWKGRRITIERKSTAKAPMSLFRAYDTDSGKELGALSGENCGRTLCGVERSVFERTAFIRQLGMSVGEDDALEKRLGALVSTGEEQSRSAPQLEKELSALKNRLAGRAGRIPRLRTELTEAEQHWNALETLNGEISALEEEKTALEREFQRLDILMNRIDSAKRAQGQIAMEELGAKLRDQEQLCQRLEEMISRLPADTKLRDYGKQLDRARDDLETARMEAAFVEPRTPRPQPPGYFAGLTVEGAEEKLRRDMEDYREKSKERPKKKLLPLLLCFLLFGAAVAVGVLSYFELLPFAVPLPIAAGVAASSLTLFLVLWIVLQRRNLRRYRSLLEAQQILKQYKADTVEELPQLLEAYKEAQAKYEQIAEAEEEEIRQLTSRMNRAQRACDDLVKEIAAFAPECTNMTQARQILAEAAEAHNTLTAEKRLLENQRTQYANMRKLFGDSDLKIDYEALAMDESKLRYEHRVAGQKLRNVSDRLAALKGRMEATGNREAMEERKSALHSQLVEAKEKLQALELAQEVLELADGRVRSRFSPRITAEAGRILGQLTRGKYPAVSLSPDMQLFVRDGALQRPAAAMSCGTADQMYLALRLAMCRMLLPEDAPLILDDALVNFDDDRCQAAIEVLEEEAKNRQVILFTCRTL